MDAAKLIDAKQEGVSFERILQAVRQERECISNLPEDQLDFFESMVSEIRKASDEMDKAIKSDDLAELKRISESVRDIFQMIEDSCEGS